MTTQRGSTASGVRRLLILRMALAVMAVLAVLKLGDEFGRLLAGQPAHGAGDLRLRRLEVLAWFSGAPVYPALVSAIYPPASYILFWPLTGWLSVTSTIWLWAMTSVVALVATLRLTIRDCRVTARAELWTLVLLLLSMNATGVAIGNGQVILHVLPLLLAAMLWVHTRPASWRRDVLVAACFLGALVKPNLSAPFFWILLCSPGGWRPAALTAIGYAGLTVLASHYQPYALTTLLTDWIATARVQMFKGYGDVNSLILAVGVTVPSTVLDLSLLGLWGAWVCRHRGADRWIVLGATALFSRFWTYHRVYDDVLVFVAEVALFRIATGATDDRAPMRHLAEVLLFLTAIAMLWPARLLVLPGPAGLVFRAGHVLVWATVLVFLMARARRRSA